MKTTIWTAFFAVAATCALAEVPPVLTTEPVAQKWGEEADDEVQRDGLLFWRNDCGALYIGDGETPGGKAVCVGLPPDLYSWTNDVSANGHALLWGGGWSQQAEGGSLLVRLGTNSWLRFVAADAGTLANLAVSDLDQADGTMRLTADTADPGAVLLVATNLLDPEAWQPATNAQIVATTDASTTWLITLLDPFVPEFYRVRVTTTLEAGIHAERTLHANAGIEMGGETWTNFPDMATYASTGSVATVASDLATHTSSPNPHGITAEGLGALTNETDTIALGALNIASNALHGEIAAHASATTNPHAVTAAQVGALPLTGGTITGHLSVTGPDYRYGKLSHGLSVTNSGIYSFAGGEKTKTSAQNCFAFGYLSQATAYAAYANGGRCMAQGSYAQAAGLRAISSNALAYTWQGVNNNADYGSHGDGTWNINPVGGADGVFIGQSNLIQIINAAVAAWMDANGY
ncbi:MAG: hypothetical protein ILO10_04515 [Kiritimatiellae bacterium]|nr:hypothetical protein [Kiritimatiellia bacterium]